MHRSSLSRPLQRDHHFNLLMTQQPTSSCHFLVLLTFDHLHSSVLLAYDNSVWCALEVHNGDIYGSFSDFFVILEEISLWLQPSPQIGYRVCSTPVGQPHSSFSHPAFSTAGATTTSSLAFTNFTSLEIFIVELLSPVYPNSVLSKKGFWWERTSISFFVDTRSTLTFAWTTSSSRNFTLV